MIRALRATRAALVLAALAACSCLLAGSLLVVLVRASPAVAAGEPVGGAEIVLDGLTPLAPGPGATLAVRGRLHNGGNATLTDVSVRLRYSRIAVRSRGELAQLAAGERTREGRAATDSKVAVADLVPGSTAGFALSAALDDLRLGAFGVYPVGVEALSGTTRAGLLWTFLPWTPNPTAIRPTRLVWLWPLADRPRRTVDGAFVDDGLAEEVAPGGRLAGLLSAGAAHPGITWVIDPMLLEDLAQMSSGYDVPGLLGSGASAASGSSGQTGSGGQTGSASSSGASGGTTTPGSGRADAAAFLSGLRAAVGPGSAIPLPYADPDLVAAQADQRLLPAGIGRAREVLERLLPGAQIGLVPSSLGGTAAPSEGLVAAPPGGFADLATIKALAATGAIAVVLAETALPASGVVYTATGRASLTVAGRKLSVVLTDPGLAQALGPATADESLPPPSPLTIRQRFLAETAMITAERPGSSRLVALAPPRDWEPGGTVASDLLTATTTVPWLRPATFTDALATPPPVLDRDALTYPSAAASSQLPADYVSRVLGLRARVDRFSDVLTAPQRVRSDYEQQTLRLLSASLRTDAERRSVLLGRTTAGLTERERAVRVLPQAVTVGADRANLPVTVVNDLDQAVTVRVAFSSDSPRLRVAPVQPVTIGAGRKLPVLVPVEALANGVVSVSARVVSPRGFGVGPPAAIRVRVARYGGAAVGITVGAAVLLFLAAARNIVLRVRRRSGPRAEPPVLEPAPAQGPATLAATPPT